MIAANADVLDAIAVLQRLSDLLQVRREQLAAEVGLTVRQWQVLEQISTEHFMPSLFARERDCTPANISKTLRHLQDKGLITVAVSREDGRQRDYALTAAGRRTLGRLRASRQRAIDAVWGALDPEEVARFRTFGADLAERLEAYSAVSG